MVFASLVSMKSNKIQYEEDISKTRGITGAKLLILRIWYPGRRIPIRMYYFPVIVPQEIVKKAQMLY
jgi:hypothetical protein